MNEQTNDKSGEDPIESSTEELAAASTDEATVDSTEESTAESTEDSTVYREVLGTLLAESLPNPEFEGDPITLKLKGHELEDPVWLAETVAHPESGASLAVAGDSLDDTLFRRFTEAGIEKLLPWLPENLARYEKELACRVPFPEGDTSFLPPLPQ